MNKVKLNEPIKQSFNYIFTYKGLKTYYILQLNKITYPEVIVISVEHEMEVEALLWK